MKKKDILTLNAWVEEAQWAARDWRAESWRDCEMYDGGDAQWTQLDFDNAIEAGIDPLTINRTFPVVNMILGSEAINKSDMIAKGRTQDDGEISQVMTEALKYVMDQCSGEHLISEAFKDQIISGFGCLSPTLNMDPRKEKITLKYRDWKEVFFDPFSSPWWSPERTRYVFMQRWMDLDDLQGMFPEKAQDLEVVFDELAGTSDERATTFIDDNAWLVEDNIRHMSGRGWIDSERKRIRPVEMWYPVWEKCRFATFADGRCIEITKNMHWREQAELMMASEEVMEAPVKKMQVCTFVHDLELAHRPTPYSHDQYPFVPMLAYIDRLRQPFGVPRQIRGQDEEVNKRRSMALAMLKNRRVTMEKGAIADDESAQAVYEEAQKVNSFIILKDGGMPKFRIDEQANFAAPQMDILRQSENEIQEISGPNQESMGYKSNVQSGVAIEKKIVQGGVTTATLFANMRRSLKMVAEQTVANVQGNWKHPKILRITDRLSGADRFVELNQRIAEDGKPIQIKNNITQGVYDIVISEAPQTDTVREQNMNLIIEWVKKSPPEAIPLLMQMAFEMSNLPNKDVMVAKLKPLLGGDPTEDDLSPEEIKAKLVAQMEAAAEESQKQAEIEDTMIKLDLKEKSLRNVQAEADIKETLAGIEKLFAEVQKTQSEMKIDQTEMKIELMEKINGVKQEAAA